MPYGELVLPPERPQRNARTGRFMKGHVPHNKGKHWSEYVGKRAQKRMAKGWKNLEKYRPENRSDLAGRCRKEVIGVDEDGTWHCFRELAHAAQYVGGLKGNVGRCCRLNEARHINRKTGKINTNHKYNGVRFYFETDSIWLEKIKQ